LDPLNRHIQQQQGNHTNRDFAILRRERGH
jgi:hypothetical protein